MPIAATSTPRPPGPFPRVGRARWRRRATAQQPTVTTRGTPITTASEKGTPTMSSSVQTEPTATTPATYASPASRPSSAQVSHPRTSQRSETPLVRYSAFRQSEPGQRLRAHPEILAIETSSSPLQTTCAREP